MLKNSRAVILLVALGWLGCADSEQINPVIAGAGGDGGGPGTAGTSGQAGDSGTAGVSGGAGTTGAAGSAAAGTTGTAGNGAAGNTGVAGNTGTGRGGTTGGAGTGGTTGSGGRGGSAAGGTTGSGGRGGSSAGGTGGTGAPTFTMVYNMVVMPNCGGSGCHQTSPYAGSLNMSSQANAYTSLKTKLVAGDAANSTFYKELNSGGMPKGKAKLSATLITLVKDWINAGALNN